MKDDSQTYREKLFIIWHPSRNRGPEPPERKGLDGFPGLVSQPVPQGGRVHPKQLCWTSGETGLWCLCCSEDRVEKYDRGSGGISSGILPNCFGERQCHLYFHQPGRKQPFPCTLPTSDIMLLKCQFERWEKIHNCPYLHFKMPCEAKCFSYVWCFWCDLSVPGTCLLSVREGRLKCWGDKALPPLLLIFS